MTDARRDEIIAGLRRRRPRDRFVRGSVGLLLALAAASWASMDAGAFLQDRSLRNFERFLQDVRPWPLRDAGFDPAGFAGWWTTTIGPDAPRAMLDTAALAVVAIVLAGACAALLALPAARNWAAPEPFLPGPAPPRRITRLAWGAVVAITRFLLIFSRAVPEYVWAFVLLPLVGLGPWPLILALAIHNAGILGRLNAEVVENSPPGTLRALRAAGASRSQIAAAALVPAHAGRGLLYLFYRWETCVREATVLGLLGFVSLGWYVQQARAASRYDEMVQWVALGAVLILAGDVVSGLVRRRLRRA